MKIVSAQTAFLAAILAYAAAVPRASTQALCEKPKHEEVVHDTIVLNPKGTDFSKAVDLTFTDGNVWIMEGSGGAVDLHDYNTGLHFVRANETAPCYVYPTMHSFQDGIKLEAVLKDGLRQFENVDIAQVVPLSVNMIVDASFAPAESAKYCDRYQWARIDHYVIAHNDMSSEEDAHMVVKRGAPGQDGQPGQCTSNCVYCP